jgi:hypothetical protein
MTVVKELERISAVNKQDDARLIDQINSMLSEYAQNDVEFLSDRGYNVRADKPSQRAEGIYSRWEIRQIAEMYHLRFLPLQCFKGKFDAIAVTKMREFEQPMPENVIDGYSFPSSVSYKKAPSYYVLAPADQFELAVWKKEDPLLFAQMPDGGYRLVHSWGNDLSAWRKILFWPLRNRETARTSVFVALLALIATAIIGATPAISAPCVVLAIWCAVVSGIACLEDDIFDSRNGPISRFISAVNWNESFK